MKRSLSFLAVVLALLAPATAQAFDPSTQAHPGACSETTVHVHQAVHDLHANEVLGTYVGVLGIDAAGKSKVKAAEEELVVVKLHRGALAANHGCEEGIVFPIGTRKLHAGEKVAIRVPRKLRGELCSGPGKDCVARRLQENVVLPINCWNIEEGKFVVTVYVRKPPPPAPKPTKVALPSATAQMSCDASAVVVQLQNGQTATASASFLINGKPKGPVAPGGAQTTNVHVDNGKSIKLTVTSGDRTLLEHVYTSNCGAPPTPTLVPTPTVNHPATPRTLPAAALTIACTAPAFEVAGEALVTLYNSTKATQSASFQVVVNGTSSNYGPLDPGQIMTTPPTWLPYGEDLEVEVISGGSIILSELWFSPCTGG